MYDFDTQTNPQEAAIVNDQSNFYGKFGEIVEETNIGYRIKLNEEWATFFEDYMPVMVAATGKDEKRIKNQVDLFKKPQKIKANKPILAALVDQLDIYLVYSKALDDTGPCAIRLRDKFARWAAEPEKAITLDSL